MKRKILSLLLLFIFLGALVSAIQGSNLIQKRKQQLHLVHLRLLAAKQRLEKANERKKEIAHQLRESWHDLHMATDKLNLTSVQLRQTKLNLEFSQARLRATQSEYERQKNHLVERLSQVGRNDENTVSSFLTGNGSYSGLLDQSYDLGLILHQDVSIAHAIKEKKDAISSQTNRLNGEYKQVHNEQNEAKVEYRTYSNITAERQGILGEAEKEQHLYAHRVVELEEISAELEKELEDSIRREEAKLRASHHAFGNVGALLWPVSSRVITSGFGERYHPLFHEMRFHTGVDIASASGTPIHAAAGGIVIYAGWYGGYGNAVVIDHGSGLSTLYAHCSALYVRKGESIAAGQVIAAVGSTGYATGPHLHFEVRENGVAINPMVKF